VPESVPFITVVMPVRNEVRFIRDTLGQLLGQDYPPERYEIIVADGMSDDGTREAVLEIAGRHPQVVLMDNPGRLSGSGRNVGFRSGRGDYFVVVDGHCLVPERQFFGDITACFARSGADCLGRPQPLDPPGLTTFQKCVALVRESRLGHGADSLIYGGYEGFASPVSNGAAYARHVFDKVGYVDESFDAAEDVEFNYRVEQAGFRCYTSPKLTVRYYPRDSFAGLFRQMCRYGRGRRKFTRKHPQALTLNQLVPATFAVGLGLLMVSLLLHLFSGMALPLLLTVIPYGVYLLLLAGSAVRVACRQGVAYAVLFPAVLFVVHFALGYGFLKETAQ
jgi:succinoglycan biosynthesis protein ExoA